MKVSQKMIGTFCAALGLALAAGCGAMNKVNKSKPAQALGLSAPDGETQDDGVSPVTQSNQTTLATATIKLSGAETPTQRQSMAKVTADQANATALTQVPGGTVARTDLDDENGYLVYSVDVIKDGKSNDVKIDAGNGKFLYVDGAQDNGPEKTGA